jgi:hypothetical protein
VHHQIVRQRPRLRRDQELEVRPTVSARLRRLRIRSAAGCHAQEKPEPRHPNQAKAFQPPDPKPRGRKVNPLRYKTQTASPQGPAVCRTTLLSRCHRDWGPDDSRD